MSKKEQGKAPVLRFKGFTDDWEQRKLGDIATFINGRAYSKNELLHQGKYKVLRVGNFYTNDSWYYSDMELDEKYYANYGDLLYTWSATFGPHIWKGEKVIYHYHIWKIVLSDEITKKFTLELLEHDKNRLLADKNGSTMIHITKKDMENKEIVIPSSTNEQDKVGLLLTKLDYLITLQQRKTQLLNKVIKYLTQNLFIQSDSLTPVLRFLSFNKKWTSTKIGKIMDVGAVKRIHQSDWRESGIPFYRARDIIAIRQNKELPSPIYISHEQYENYSETSGKVNMNDLLVTGVGTIGVPLLVKKTPIYFKDGNIIWLKNSNKLNGNFLFYVFQSSKIQDYIHSIAGVGTVPTYTIDSAKKTPIVFPEKSEQTDIANLLNTVTNMVHMSKSKKRVLMSIKNYLLQNMFI